MKREQRKDIFEAVGLVAIVASLIFLALEVRQNTTALAAAAYQTRSDALQQLAVTMSTSETLAEISARVYIRGGDCAADNVFCGTVDTEYVDSLSITEKSQYSAYLRAHAFRLQGMIVQYEYGFLSDDYHARGVVGAIRSFMPRWVAFDVPKGVSLQRYVDDYEQNRED